MGYEDYVIVDIINFLKENPLLKIKKMIEFKRKASFIKYFKTKIVNFDETKIWFEFLSNMREVKICFVNNGKLEKFTCYMYSYCVDKIANHFIDFLNIGIFNEYFYVVAYGDDSPEIYKNRIYKFKYSELGKNKFYESSSEFSQLMIDLRCEYGENIGFAVVGKPMNDEEIFEYKK